MDSLARRTNLSCRPAQGQVALRRAVFICATLWLSLAIAGTGCGFRAAPTPPPAPRAAPVAAKPEAPDLFENVKVVLKNAVDGEPDQVQLIGLPPYSVEMFTGLDANHWTTYFKVCGPVSSDWGKAKSHKEMSPLLGDYHLQGNTLVFQPRFPLRPGSKYGVSYKLFYGSSMHFAPFGTIDTPPAKEVPPASVAAVYPSANVLPENQLKFYLHFSAPMSRGQAYERIHLLKASGEEVETPFLELTEELWDDSGTRFTLFFDPGRIKRGLKPREDVGPSLVEGESYTLVIDQQWPEVQGKPLKESYRKAFRVAAPDDAQPDPSKWKLSSPRSESTGPLVVKFGESLDHAMLERVLAVEDSAGKVVPGRMEIDTEESRWSFTPNAPWQPGEYALVVETTLEDLAGNSLAKPFEVDVFRDVERETKAQFLKVPIRVER